MAGLVSCASSSPAEGAQGGAGNTGAVGGSSNPGAGGANSPGAGGSNGVSGSGGVNGTGAGGAAMITDGGGPGGPPLVKGFSCQPVADPMPLVPTYFVDFDAGSDTAAGTSQGAAWKHAPGDMAATGVAASAKLAAGNVVLFKGGVDYKGSIDVPASGTMGAPIVYDGNSRGTWGTGLAVIDGEETRSRGFRLNARSYVTIDSFEIKSFDKAMSSTAVGIEGGSHDEVKNCRISDVYYPKNPGGTSWEKQSGNGIAVNNSPFANISHNTVRDVGNAGISVSAGSGMVVDGSRIACNEVTNMNWGIAVALGNSTPGTKITGVAVLGNYIHDFDQYYVASVWHRDGIFVFARPDTDQATVENLEIAYNYLEDNTSDFGSTAWLYFEYVCKGFKVHHNVLNASRSYYGVRIMGDGFQVEGNHVFSNNVIDNANSKGDGMHMQESSGIKLYDNIFYNDGNGYIVAKTSMTGFAADYNLFFRPGGPGNVVALNAGPAEAPGGDAYDVAKLKAMTQIEAHGAYGDPQFRVDPKMIDSDPTGFAPKASSPAVDHGNDQGFVNDFSGNPVPKGGAPDIGAFELQP